MSPIVEPNPRPPESSRPTGGGDIPPHCGTSGCECAAYSDMDNRPCDRVTYVPLIRKPLGHRMEWLRIGQQIPGGHEVVRVHMRESRPTGAGTNQQEWLLLELKEIEL